MSDLAPDRQGLLEQDEHRIHWEYFGRGDREAIVLLNGLAMHTKAWYGFLPRLLPELDVVLYDYPGQGESSARDVPYFIDRIAGYLGAILDAISLDRVHLMGISYGGFVGLEFARRFQERLDTLSGFGVRLALRPDQLDAKALKQALREFAKQNGVPSFRHKIFETSGTTAGQATAFNLLGPGGYLGVVGFTPKSVELRLSNLMAFDATAQGNWGCLPEHYPAVLELVLAGKVALHPFVERRPLASINETFEDVRAGRGSGRVVLVPES